MGSPDRERNSNVVLTEAECEQTFPKEWILMAVDKDAEEDEIAKGEILCHDTVRNNISVALDKVRATYPKGKLPFIAYIFKTNRGSPESREAMERFILEQN